MKHKVIYPFSNYYSIQLCYIVLYHNYLHKSHFFPKCNYQYLGDIIISAKKKKKEEKEEEEEEEEEKEEEGEKEEEEEEKEKEGGNDYASFMGF